MLTGSDVIAEDKAAHRPCCLWLHVDKY